MGRWCGLVGPRARRPGLWLWPAPGQLWGSGKNSQSLVPLLSCPSSILLLLQPYPHLGAVSPEATSDKDLCRTCLSQRPGREPREPPSSPALFPQGNSGHLQGMHIATQPLSFLARIPGQGLSSLLSLVTSNMWKMATGSQKVHDIQRHDNLIFWLTNTYSSYKIPNK